MLEKPMQECFFEKELGPRIKELLEIGKSGVVASPLAACHRLHTHGQECCRAVAVAVHSESESAGCIVPQILFLDSYFHCKERASWRWATNEKMHTLGCLILQTIFRYPREFIQPYVTTITSMEAAYIFETAKDQLGESLELTASEKTARQQVRMNGNNSSPVRIRAKVTTTCCDDLDQLWLPRINRRNWPDVPDQRRQHHADVL